MNARAHDQRAHRLLHGRLRVDASLLRPAVIGAVDAGSPAAAGRPAAGRRDPRRSTASRCRPGRTRSTTILLRPDAPLKLRVRGGGEERELERALRGDRTAERIGHDRRATRWCGWARCCQVSRRRRRASSSDDAILRDRRQADRELRGDPGRSWAARRASRSRSSVWRDGRDRSSSSVTPAGRRAPGRASGSAPRRCVKKFGPAGAVGRGGCAGPGSMTKQTFDVLERLVTARISPKTMMGPLGIAQASGDAARGGAGSLLLPGRRDQPAGRDPEPVPAAAARRRPPRDPGGRGRRSAATSASTSRPGS